MRPPGNWPKPAAAVRPDDPERPKSPSAVASRLGAATTSRDEGRKKLKSAAGKLKEPEALKLIEDAQKFSDKLGAGSLGLHQAQLRDGSRAGMEGGEAVDEGVHHPGVRGEIVDAPRNTVVEELHLLRDDEANLVEG